MKFGRIVTGSLIDHLFPLMFSPDEGGGIGDISQDLADLDAGDADAGDGGDAGGEGGDADDDADDPAGDKDRDKNGPETFGEDEEGEGEGDQDDEGEGEGEGDDKDDDDKDAEIFEGRPTLTDLKGKYPKIFKEFPELREVIFREQELSKHFGTVEEAETASIKAGSFDTLEAALLGGDTGPILDQLSQNAPEALALVIDNFLPKVLARSQDLYLRATTPVIEQFLHTTYEHGKTVGDKNLMLAAQHAANFIFGKPEIPDPARRAAGRGPHPAEKKLEEERAAWQQTRLKEAGAEVSALIDVELEKDILKGLDPERKLSERQRSRLVKDIKDEIDEQLRKDTAFGKQMSALWKRAGSADYPREQRASIKSAFLARAKALVPSVRTRLRAEWFGEKLPKSGKTPTDKKKDGQPEPQKKRTIQTSGGAAGGGGKRPPTPRDVDYTRTSDEDLINGRFARRK